MNLEYEFKLKLAIVHHVIHFFESDDLLTTHISARIPDTPYILITPQNISFKNVTENNIVLINMDDESTYNTNVSEQALNIHIAAYKARDDINCIIHTHSDYGSIVASLEGGLKFTNQHSLRFYGDVNYHPFKGLAVGDEGDQIAKSLSNARSLILCNHGLISTGYSIEDCIYSHYYLEKTCKLYIKTLQCGVTIKEIDESLCIKTKKIFDKIRTPDLEFSYFQELTSTYRQ